MIEELPLERIRDHPRDIFRQLSDAELQELAESIGERGLIHPLVVRRVEGGREYEYELISGRQRRKAIMKFLNWKTVPAIIRDVSAEEAELMMIDANLETRQLSPMETARAIRRKKELLLGGPHNEDGSRKTGKGRYSERLAVEFGFSKAKIERYDRLNDLIEPFQQMVEMGKLGPTSAQHIAMLDQGIQVQLYEQLGEVIGELTSDAAKRLRRENDRGYMVLDVMQQKVQELEEKLASYEAGHQDRESLQAEIRRLNLKKKELEMDVIDRQNAVQAVEERSRKKGAELLNLLEQVTRPASTNKARLEALVAAVAEEEVNDITKAYALKMASVLGDIERLISRIFRDTQDVRDS